MNKKNITITVIAIITITISIIYNTLPRLQLNGSKNMIISYRQEYEEPGVIVKNANSKYMSRIKIDSNIDTKKVGNYYIDYSLKIGGKTLHVRRNVKVIDDIAPVIKLKGNQITEMSINKEYEEKGYTAQDEYDGDLTDKVEIIGEVDTKNYGEYIITYRVSDNNNNITEVNRIVKIIDEEPPKIICKTDYSAFKKESKKIIGCTAQDNFDGDITNKIEKIGKYDTSKPGIYNIVYKIEDDAGNTTEKNHNIIIFEENKTLTNKLEINLESSEKIEKLIQNLNEIDINPTIFINIDDNQVEKQIKLIEKIIDTNNEISVSTKTVEPEIYNDFETFKANFEKIKKELYENYNKQIKEFKFPENIDSNKEKVINQIKQYLEENKIEYKTNSKIENTKNIIDQETTEDLIKEIILNESTEEIRYNINNTEETFKKLKEIVKIQKDINPDIKIEINIK